MRKFNSVEEITTAFIKDGWSENISFTELTEDVIKQENLAFLLRGIECGKKYFRMNETGNIFKDNGSIALYNIKANPIEVR